MGIWMTLPTGRRMLLSRIGRGSMIRMEHLDDLVVHYDPDDTANLADVADEMTTLLLNEFASKQNSLWWNSIGQIDS